MIGFSRSQPNEQKIAKIANDNSIKKENPFNNVEFIQSDYDDPDSIKSLIQSKKSHQQLYIYLAVPPQVILEFLKTAGEYINTNTHIIIEKPFGRSSEEAAYIIDLLTHHSLVDNVHFIDHYLFKSAVRFSNGDQRNFRNLFSKKIRSIDISAIEELGVEDRKSYYDKTGAFKDMFIHLYSLLTVSLELINRSIDCYNITPIKVIKGQYKSYLKDIAEQQSRTDTYFELQVKLRPNNIKTVDRFNILTKLESGKKLGRKTTTVTIRFRDDSLLSWNIAPKQKITYSFEDQIKEIYLSNADLEAHENMYQDLLDGNLESFVKVEELIESWQVFDDSCSLSGCSNNPFVYKDSHYPPKKIK